MRKNNNVLVSNKYLIQTFVVNVVAAFKNVHRFGKHAFISDSSDDFRFCPRASVQINPSFEFSGHLPIHFVDDAVPVKTKQITHIKKFQKNMYPFNVSILKDHFS
jgi:hypothetical protein